MQETPKSIEREALRRIPGLLGELLDEPGLVVFSESQPALDVVDLAMADDHGRRWLFEVKTSSRPGQVDRAAQQLGAFAGDRDAIAVLVVPFMSSAGAEVAGRRGLNWLDLSGNAHIRDENFYVSVRGRPNMMQRAGRPSSPFAPKSARVSRFLLLDPERWWRQKDLAEATGLDDGNVSRIVRRLDEEELLERRGPELRPREPDLLLDAWAEDYNYDRHDSISGHLSGSGIEVTRKIAARLRKEGVHHAATGLAAAWAMDHFARFRLTTIYVDEDPRLIAEQIEMRVEPKGANIQLLGPDDAGVFEGERDCDGLCCVSSVQVYLDLQRLPERAADAADFLRQRHLKWNGRNP